MKHINIKLIVALMCLMNFVNAQVVTTLAGSTTVGSADGTGAAARFNYPLQVALDGKGNLYVGDFFNNEIRAMVISSNTVTTLAGTTYAGSANGTGASASFHGTSGVAADGSGNLYVADWSNNEIRKIVISSGVVTTFAGSTTGGSNNGIGTAASFSQPTELIVDGGSLYVADAYNNEIRQIVISTGAVTTLAGNTTAGSNDGTGTAASFNHPSGLVADGAGNLYVTDTYNNEIRKIVISTGVVTTLAGTTVAGSANGIGTAAGFNYPEGIAVDAYGNLYVADANNNEIRQIVISSGTVTTLAGSLTAGSADGTGSAANFNFPDGLALDANGNLYVGDAKNNEIRKVAIPVGINEIVANNNVNIYPNPNNGEFTIQIENRELLTINSKLFVYDELGREVYTQALNQLQTKISPNLINGIYIIQIVTDNGIINKKITVLK